MPRRKQAFEPTISSETHAYDPETRQVVRRQIASTEAAQARYFTAIPTGDGRFDVQIPELQSGLALPSASAIEYDVDDLDYWRVVNNNDDGLKDIALANYWWRKDPIVFSCVKLLTTIANVPMKIYCENEEVKALAQIWMDQAMPHSFRSEFYLEYFRSSTVPILKLLVPYVPREYKFDKIPQPAPGGNIEDRFYSKAATERVVGENNEAFQEYKKALDSYQAAASNVGTNIAPRPERLEILAKQVADKQYKWLRGMIPGKYIILNPTEIKIEGPPEMHLLREPFLYPSNDLRQAVAQPIGTQSAVLNRLPSEIVDQVRGGLRKVWLSPNIFSYITADKQGFERYATPIVTHCKAALEMKRQLMQMDKAVIQNIKDRLLLVKIGNDKFPVTPGSRALENAADAYQSVGRSGVFFWSHTIEMEWVEPNIEPLSDHGKYDYWDTQIRTAYGISPVLTGTSDKSGTTGNSALNFVGVQEHVRNAREALVELAQKEIDFLRTALKISDEIVVKVDGFNINDPAKLWSLLQTSVQQGFMDPQTALETLGYYFPEVLARMKKTKKWRDDGLFVPAPTTNPADAVAGVKTGGRPASQPNPKSSNKTGKPRSSKPAAKPTPKAKPKKVKAHLKMMGQKKYMVMPNDVDSQERAEFARYFDLHKDQVITEKQFAKLYPDEPLYAPWPKLTAGEMLSVASQAAAAVDKSRTYYSTIVEQFKKGSTPGGKANYLTEGKRAEFQAASQTQAISEIMEPINKEAPMAADEQKAFSDYFQEALFEIGDGVDKEYQNIYAQVITAARLKKKRSWNQKKEESNG